MDTMHLFGARCMSFVRWAPRQGDLLLRVRAEWLIGKALKGLSYKDESSHVPRSSQLSVSRVTPFGATHFG